MEPTRPAFLIVRDAAGEVLRVPFGTGRIIVGRSPQAPVRLDHGMVSRQHSEFWRDDAGRYHARDLDSRNGTLVNGQPITETLLAPGDQIAIGPFVLSVLDRSASAEPFNSTRVVLTDGAEGRISTLKEHAPPRIDAGHLTTLNDFSQRLLATAGEAARLDLLCRLMVGPQFRGQWAAMVRTSRRGTDITPQLLCEAYAGLSHCEPYLSRGVLRKVRETGEPVLASNSSLPAQQYQDINVSIAPEVVAMAAVACQVAQSADTVDVLYVMLPPMLGSPEWLALVNLAVMQYQQAEAAWAARKQAEAMAVMERELSQARHIQMRLVPKDPQFPGLDIAIGFVPCHWVGGDYVDAVRMNDGRALLAIADVCGKGLAAALVASSVHTMIHSGVLSGLSLQQLMANLNRYLSGTLSSDSFVTMVAIVIDPKSGEVEMVNAGHPPPLLLSSGKSPRRIEMEGNLPLSLEREEILLHRFTVAGDEMLALYSDGLSELPDAQGKLLGIAGLSAELADVYESSSMTAVSASERLSQRLDALQGSRPSADDRTYLLARRATGLL